MRDVGLHMLMQAWASSTCSSSLGLSMRFMASRDKRSCRQPGRLIEKARHGSSCVRDDALQPSEIFIMLSMAIKESGPRCIACAVILPHLLLVLFRVAYPAGRAHLAHWARPVQRAVPPQAPLTNTNIRFVHRLSLHVIALHRCGFCSGCMTLFGAEAARWTRPVIYGAARSLLSDAC